MTALAEALRTEIRTILDADGKPFTIAIAARIMKLAEAAKTVLVASGGVAEAIAHVEDLKTPSDEDDDVSPMTAPKPTAAETFGTRMIQEFIAILPVIFKKSDDSLMPLLIMARKHGMTDVAAELEAKMFGKPLDGDRPFKADEFIDAESAHTNGAAQ
jgi:hypothetical protein